MAAPKIDHFERLMAQEVLSTHRESVASGDN